MQQAPGALALTAGRFVAQDGAEKDRQFATTLARGLDVLRSFSPDSLRLGNKDIVARTGLPKATVSRLTYTLTQLGYLRRNAHQNKYELAPQALSICQPLLAGFTIRHLARPVLERVAAETGGSAGLATCDRNAMVCIEVVHARSSIPGLEIGAATPMLSGATGHAYIAGCVPDERTALLNRLRVKDEAAFRVAESTLESALEDYRQQGCCIWRGDIVTAAVPLRRPGTDSLVLFAALPAGDRAGERLLPARLCDAARTLEHLVRGEEHAA